jgi:hypothetical protein
MLPVYILERTPGAEGRAVAWEDIYRTKRKIFICYRAHREISNHGVAPRARKFLVFWDTHCHQVSSHYTLAAAEKAAARFALHLAREAA